MLDLDEVSRTAEFRRELVSYWSQGVKATTEDGLALLRADPVDRDIFFHHEHGARIIFADSESQLESWLSNAGVNAKKPYAKTRLAWPRGLEGPDTYPKTGRELIALLGQQALEGKFPIGGKLPVVLGIMVDATAVFVGALLAGASQRVITAGFRKSSPRPQRLVADLFKAQGIAPMSIERLDPSWIHGRDSNLALPRMAASSIGVIGCGAIGGYLARGLAQAGVGSLSLVDNDVLKAANLGRHVLGAEWIGRSKAKAVAKQFGRDFPHAAPARVFPTRFQDLSPPQLVELATCDVIALAGVDLAAELAVDRWISGLENPPTRVWTWTEEFALAGQAVALFGQDRMAQGLGTNGRFIRCATSGWDASITTRGEAGCGTSFQPYDSGDMMQTVLMAQRLTTDVVLSRLTASTHHTWFGDRDAVVNLGAQPSANFAESFREKAFPWPP